MQHQRPVWVSIILAFYLLFSGGGLLLLGQVLSDFGGLSTDLQKRFGHVEMHDIVWIVGIQLLPLVGAAALFMMMKVARLIFAAYVALLVDGLVWRASAATLADAVAAHGLLGTLLALGVGASVCQYAWQLGKRGALV
jgi:hypothetical protein